MRKFINFFIKISTNANQGHITAMLMPTAPTPKDRSTAHVIRDTLEMESRVTVGKKNLYRLFLIVGGHIFLIVGVIKFMKFMKTGLFLVAYKGQPQ